MPSDPLLELDDITLWNTQVILHLSCARNPAVFRKKRRQYLCGLINSLDTEAGQRGLASPAPPYHTSQVRPHEL